MFEIPTMNQYYYYQKTEPFQDYEKIKMNTSYDEELIKTQQPNYGTTEKQQLLMIQSQPLIEPINPNNSKNLIEIFIGATCLIIVVYSLFVLIDNHVNFDLRDNKYIRLGASLLIIIIICYSLAIVIYFLIKYRDVIINKCDDLLYLICSSVNYRKKKSNLIIDDDTLI